MVTTTVLASSAGSLFLRLTSAAAAANGQLGAAALAGGARHFSSSAPGSELKAHLAAMIPSQQVRRGRMVHSIGVCAGAAGIT